MGDTSLPEGPISGGSMATGSLVPAVFQAADKATQSLLELATKSPNSPYFKRKPTDLAFEGGKVPVHIHCIANWRVSAFLYRYHRERGMAEGDARALLERQWSPDNNNHPAAPQWAAIIADPSTSSG